MVHDYERAISENIEEFIFLSIEIVDTHLQK